MKMFEVTLNISPQQFKNWIRNYQMFKHNLMHAQMGPVTYDEVYPYFIYYAPEGIFNVYWQQLSRKELKMIVKLRDYDDAQSIRSYIEELLNTAREELGVDTELSALEHIRELILLKTRRLRKLEKRQAAGGNSTDPSVEIEIEDIKREIIRLEEQKSEIL